MDAPKGLEIRTELGQLAYGVRHRVAGAEDQLARKLQEPLRIMCRARRIDPHEADDLAQEAVMTVIERLRGEEHLAFDAIATYARNTLVNMLIGDRRRDSRREALMDKGMDQVKPTPPLPPDKFLDRVRVTEAIEEAIEQLSQPRDRELIRQYYLHQRDKNELCEEFDLASRQFDRVIFNARQRLLQALQRRGWRTT
ncbi:MAG: sigma-70 family RNA polymerase sigma factor [Xanthomonadales bacterium]|nr:sigma-70 family RNA polymerase sigma factor [Xanthomonadales bacterium]